MSGKTPTEQLRESRVEKAAENAVGLTIAERLTRRAKANTTVIQLLPDAEGDIFVEMHLPTWDDTCELTQIDVMMTTKSGRMKLAKVMHGLCATDELDLAFLAFWKSGAIGLVDMRLIVEGLLAAAAAAIKSTEEVQKAQTFRKD
jgi:hypothetical protein